MVDEAHATGAVGPGGRGSVAAAGLSGEVDVVVGTLGKALGSYGAYVCAERRDVDFLVNTRPPLHLLDRAAAAGGRRRRGGAGDARSRAGAGRAAAGKRRDAARRARRRGPRAPAARQTQIVPIEVGDAETTMELCERVLERGVFAQGIRPPTVPEGSSRLRFTVMATHRRRASWSGAARLVGGAARELGLARAPAPWPPEGRGRRRLRHRHRHRGRQDRRRRRVARTLAAEGKRVAVFKPAVTGLDEAGRDRPRAAAPRRRLDPERRGDRPLPLRPAGLAAPGGGAGRRGDRPGAAARSGRAPRPRAPTPSSARASAACWCPLCRPAYLVRDLAADLGYPLVSPPRPASARSTTPC